MSRFSLLMGLGAKAGATGRRLGMRALDELLSDPQRADAFDLAARGVQGGRRLLDEQMERLIGAMGLATQGDLDRVNRKIATLRRLLENLVDEVEDTAARGPSSAEGSGAVDSAGYRGPPSR